VGYRTHRDASSSDDCNPPIPSRQVTLAINGLPAGNHGFHVHTYGDISAISGSGTGGHFVGNCTSCRPANILQEVGMLNDGVPLVSNGVSTTTVTFVERVAKLWGVNGWVQCCQWRCSVDRS
jgi:hypothetical protein